MKQIFNNQCISKTTENNINTIYISSQRQNRNISSVTSLQSKSKFINLQFTVLKYLRCYLQLVQKYIQIISSNVF